jgi:hypothetical protein
MVISKIERNYHYLIEISVTINKISGLDPAIFI